MPWWWEQLGLFPAFPGRWAPCLSLPLTKLLRAIYTSHDTHFPLFPHLPGGPLPAPYLFPGNFQARPPAASGEAPLDVIRLI